MSPCNLQQFTGLLPAVFLLGVWELVNDNLTESRRTINLLQRMNIYQEVVLSALYRLLPIQVTHTTHMHTHTHIFTHTHIH